MPSDSEATGAFGLSLLDEVVLGDARGGRKPQMPLAVSVVRELTPEDIPALAEAQATPGTLLTQIRHSHHQLARAIAEGLPLHTVCAMTGYSPAYVSNLQNDPAFAELVAHYALERELLFADVMARAKALGLDALDELQARLNAPDANWSKAELMDLVELMLGKGAGRAETPGTGAGAGSPAVSIQVQFGTGPSAPKPQFGVTIDAE